MKHLRKNCLVTVTAGFLAFGLLSGTNALATEQTPCSADIAQFCKDVPQGDLRNCLERHESKLSAACKAHEATMEKTRVESREAKLENMKFRQACKDDMGKFCKEASAQGSPLQCLKEHKKELSTSCNESIQAMEEHKE